MMSRSQAVAFGLDLRASLRLQGLPFELGHGPVSWAKQWPRSSCIWAEGRRVRLHNKGNVLQAEFIFRSDVRSECLLQGAIMTLPTPPAWQEVNFAIDHGDVRQITQLCQAVEEAVNSLHENKDISATAHKGMHNIICAFICTSHTHTHTQISKEVNR